MKIIFNPYYGERQYVPLFDATIASKINYPCAIPDVIDRNHKHYAGMYAPQLDLYCSVLSVMA